jgi:4-hydroxy-tetrahydrodipicolinate synthase
MEGELLSIAKQKGGEPILSGVIPILPTPFTPEGKVDDESFIRVVEAAISSGVHGVAMFGLASEYYKLSEVERFHLTSLLVRQVAKRCPVIISIVSHSTCLAKVGAIQAVEAGADALMILPPFFLAPQTDAILRHIREVAGAVSVPVIVQYAPLQTGRIIDARSFSELRKEVPNVTHVKVDAVPSGPIISALHSLSVDSLVGYMGLHLPEDFTRGVAGVMPSVSICPAFVEIWSSLIQGDDRALELHRRILPLLNFMMQSIEGLIACEKELLLLSGIIRSNHRREPATHLDSIQRDELRRLASCLAPLLVKSEGRNRPSNVLHI